MKGKGRRGIRKDIYRRARSRVLAWPVSLASYPSCHSKCYS